MTRPFLYLPTGQLVMCGWSQTSPLRTFPIWSIFCQQPPSPLQHSVHVIYQSLPLPINWARSQASNMTVTAGGLQKRSLPLRRAGTTGHRAVDGQSHVTVWGPQTLGGGCTRCKQALTATMTNNTHLQKVQLFISATTLQQPGDSGEMKRTGKQRHWHETQNKTSLCLTTPVSEQSTCI